MNHFGVANSARRGIPRRWRLILVALCALSVCSCQGVKQSAGPSWGSENGAPPALPYSAYTGAPGQPEVAGPQGAPNEIALPYAVSGPWAPPGISQPWPKDEYLADGGDSGVPVGATAEGQIRGLKAQDTVAQYETLDGRTLVEPSNRVYLYSPRFRAVRQVVSVQQNDQFEGSVGIHQPQRLAAQQDLRTPWSNKQNVQTERQLGQKSLTTFRTRQWDGVMSSAIGPRGFQDAFLPYENLAVIRTGKFEMAEMGWLARGVTAAIAWSHTQAVQVILDRKAATAVVQNEKAETIFSVDEPPARPKLRVIKVASTPFAEPGDTVDFTIRFDNVGNQVVGNVTILDNLTTRLEYVPDSAQASVPANFSTQGNEAGSLVLRWEITDPVQPGKGGILRFRCRVR
jgi:uncharacterized repeat protein (TIGR01451 family)